MASDLHRWTVQLRDGGTLECDVTGSVEACTGALRVTNDADEPILLIRGWSLAVRSGTPVTITPAPESPSGSGGFTGRPFA